MDFPPNCPICHIVCDDLIEHLDQHSTSELMHTIVSLRAITTFIELFAFAQPDDRILPV